MTFTQRIRVIPLWRSLLWFHRVSRFHRVSKFHRVSRFHRFHRVSKFHRFSRFNKFNKFNQFNKFNKCLRHKLLRRGVRMSKKRLKKLSRKRLKKTGSHALCYKLYNPSVCKTKRITLKESMWD